MRKWFVSLFFSGNDLSYIRRQTITKPITPECDLDPEEYVSVK